MKIKLFSEAMSNLHDKYIHEAVRYKKKSQKLNVMTWAGIAACVAIVLVSVVLLLPKEPDFAELPIISVDLGNVGMGYEGYEVQDISELVSGNPWNENLKLKTLPVFKNPITFDDKFHIASGVDYEKMKACLLDVAERLGHNTDVLVITDDAPSEETKQKTIESMKKGGLEEIPEGMFDPTMLFIETEDMRLTVDRNLTVTVDFDAPISLPEQYNFTHHASYEETAAVAEYFGNEYKELIGFEKPKINIHGGDYDIDGNQSYSIEFFDASGNDTDQIVNYNFNRVSFDCDDDGKLFLIRFFNPDLSEKVGDYPIITVEQAKELLSNGNYITTVPYELPGMEYAKKVELIYRNDQESEYFMPYYRFYVELLEMKHEGMKTYGAYYVPAVSGEYIGSMPVWDGTFN